MQFRLINVYPRDFVYNYLMNVLKIIRSEDKDDGKIIKINNFLYNNLGIEDDAYTIIKYCIDNAYYSVESSKHIIDFCTRNKYKDTDYRISELLNLIEFGNLEVKGTYTLTRHLNYIRNNIGSLYELYKRKGGKI